jgi:hypothetical protein
MPKQLAVHFGEVLSKQIECSGIEFVVDRLKLIKSFYLNLIAGKQTSLPYVKKSSDGLPRGIFSFFSHLMRNHDEEKLIKLLQVHTSFVFPIITEKQKEKFYSAVLRPPKVVRPETLKWVTSLYRSEMMPIYNGPDIGKTTPLEMRQWSPSKYHPLPNGKNGIEKETILDSLCFLSSPFAQKQIGFGQAYVDYRMSALIREVTELPVDYMFVQNDKLDYVGCIAHIQEPGGKLRSIANPVRIWQVALQPFGDLLYDYLKSIPNDCSHNREKVHLLKNKLARKEKLYAYDLSNATDTFSCQIQNELIPKLLDPLNTKPRIKKSFELFRKLSREKWVDRINKRLIKWKRGQPLGLYPSFAIFSIAHHCLVRILYHWLYDDPFLGTSESNLQLCKFEADIDTGLMYPYMMLGDDLVIWDARLANLYEKVINEVGCIVSESKSFISDKLSEFAGKVILPEVVIDVGKWKELSDDNFMDLLRQTGPKGVQFLRPLQRKVFDIIGSLPEPIGLGWNPKGIPLAQRIDQFLDLYNELPDFSYRFMPIRDLIVFKYKYDYDPFYEPFHMVDKRLHELKATALRSKNPVLAQGWLYWSLGVITDKDFSNLIYHLYSSGEIPLSLMKSLELFDGKKKRKTLLQTWTEKLGLASTLFSR